MATRVIEIDGRPVALRASAGIPRLYRIKFKRDILTDMEALQKAIVKSQAENPDGGSTLPLEALTLFENIAYLMAKHADPTGVPETVEEWLDGFETFSIYLVFPVIQELWSDNLAQLSHGAKK